MFRVQLNKATSTIKDYFTDVYKLRGGYLIGNGFNGGAMLFSQHDSDGVFQRKLIVKFAMDEWVDGHLLKEAMLLSQLQFSKHIVNIVHLEKPEGHELEDDGGKRKSPGRAIMVLEFLSNGDLDTLMLRFKAKNRRVPQRIVWSVFLCRMAYPPIVPDDKAVQESIPAGKEPNWLEHGDIKGANICVGDLEAEDPEHALIPIIKLIDFGEAKFKTNPRPLSMYTDLHPVKQNIFNIGMVMLTLITGIKVSASRRDDPIIVGYEDKARNIKDVKTFGHAHLRDNTYDLRLRVLIARCLAEEPMDRPTIEELLQLCERAARTGETGEGGALYPLVEEETDEMIMVTVREMLFNADTHGT